MAIPHIFSSLTNPESNKSVLLIGAGMSYGMAPSVLELTNEIRGKCNEINKELGIDIPAPIGKMFYDWAENAFNELIKLHHLLDNDAKLRLASAMGVTTDPRFHAHIGMPLRGNTPRHRVVARFAREDRLNSIWSLNWDCILETALESVGLLPHPNPSAALSNPLPWKRWYCTWIPGDNYNPNATQKNTLYVVKPHGCVNRLAIGNASSFVVTQTEITNLPDKLKIIVNPQMMIGFSSSPLITAGWSAEEKYIHESLEKFKQQGTLLQQGEDKLSVINRRWLPEIASTNPVQHDRLGSAFDVVRDACYFSAGKTGDISMDELFQWLQTRYGLERMHVYVAANNWIAQAQELSQILNSFSEPKPTNWLNSFFDDFLSVWVRFCFNASRVIYMMNTAPVPQNLVATHRRDEHIPWMHSQTSRKDFLAAGLLVISLWRNNSCPWCFSEFPGALWNSLDGHLVLPLPAWGNQDKSTELAALKPLMDRWSWSNKGRIRKLSILPLLEIPDFIPPTDNAFVLRSSVAWLMKTSQFADPNNIGIINLSDL